MAALHHRVDKMRRADHHAVNPPRRDLLVAAQQVERADDAAGDVLARRRFDRVDDAPVFEQHGVGIGAADIDAYAAHAVTLKRENFDAKSAEDTRSTQRLPGASAPKIFTARDLIALRARRRLRVLCVTLASFASRYFSIFMRTPI
jgi:hypothetical protein